jgi:hypothetical protein
MRWRPSAAGGTEKCVHRPTLARPKGTEVRDDREEAVRVASARYPDVGLMRTWSRRIEALPEGGWIMHGGYNRSRFPRRL